MGRVMRGVERIVEQWRCVFGWAAAGVVCVLMTSCQPCNVCSDADETFLAATDLIVNPPSLVVNFGEPASTEVTLIYDAGFQDAGGGSYQFNSLTVVEAHPGRTLTLTGEPCVVPPRPGQPFIDGACVSYRLVLRADTVPAEGRVTLLARWLITSSGRVVTREAHFFTTRPVVPPRPDFQLAIGTAPNGIYATRGHLPVSIERTGGFAAPVDIQFDGLGSGITGSFAPNPNVSDSDLLTLRLPARYGAGGIVPARLHGSGGGLDRTKGFTLRIEPLFTMALDPPSANLRNDRPLDIDVTLTFDPFGSPLALSERPIELSVPNLPVGVTAVFLPDALPRPPAFPQNSVTRRLRLSTDGSFTARDDLQVRATALVVEADAAGERPYVEARLDLAVTAGLLWEFVGTNMSYGTTDSDMVGIAMQSNNLPVIAWLQGRGNQRLYLKRFDGTTFNPSPPGEPPPGLAAPSGTFGEASFALTPADLAKVAFTYDSGTRLAIASAGPAWLLGAELIFGDPLVAASGRAQSPRLAANSNEALTISYILAPNAAQSGGDLIVRRSQGAGALSVLAGPGPNGSLNAEAGARVLRDSSALALRPDGNAWVAWIEQPADPALPAALWLRWHDGNAWRGALRAPTTKPLVAASVQLLVEPSGLVVVSWLEDSPAQLKLARLDPASNTWTALSNTGNGVGSLNIGSSEPARDTSLARDASGRLLVAWTEGGLNPRVWIKRQNADTTWGLVGSAASSPQGPTKTPRIVSDANNRLFGAYAQYYAGTDPTSLNPRADIYVVRWTYD